MKNRAIPLIFILITISFGVLSSADIQIFGNNPLNQTINIMNPIVSGGGNGGGNSSFNQSAADKLYWRLDASNDNLLSSDWDMQGLWSFLNVNFLNMSSSINMNGGTAIHFFSPLGSDMGIINGVNNILRITANSNVAINAGNGTTVAINDRKFNESFQVGSMNMTKEIFMDFDTGFVGIHNDKPGSTLDVNGTIDANNYTGDGELLSNVCLTNGTGCLSKPANFTNVAFKNESNVFISTQNSFQQVNVTRIISNLQAGTGATPTIHEGAGCSTGNTKSITGDDVAGKISITCGVGIPSTTALVAQINFTSAYSSAPMVVLTPNNPNAAALSGGSSIWVDSATGNFNITSGTIALGSGTTYKWFYHVIQ